MAFSKINPAGLLRTQVHPQFLDDEIRFPFLLSVFRFQNFSFRRIRSRQFGKLKYA
jgi:hypothetical protein